ncbi:hypothetical protein KEM55_006464, partial [Ascosphaera atra]
MSVERLAGGAEAAGGEASAEGRSRTEAKRGCGSGDGKVNRFGETSGSHALKFTLMSRADCSTSEMVALTVSTLVFGGVLGLAAFVVSMSRGGTDAANSAAMAVGGSMTITLAAEAAGEEATRVKEFNIMNLIVKGNAFINQKVGLFRRGDFDKQRAEAFIKAGDTLTPPGAYNSDMVAKAGVGGIEGIGVGLLRIIGKQRGPEAMDENGVALRLHTGLGAEWFLPE